MCKENLRYWAETKSGMDGCMYRHVQNLMPPMPSDGGIKITINSTKFCLAVFFLNILRNKKYNEKIPYWDTQKKKCSQTFAVNSDISLVFSAFFFSDKLIRSWLSYSFSSDDFSISGKGSNSCNLWCKRTLTCKYKKMKSLFFVVE